ncbi:hypothetical protein VCUG_01498, partial [Vavraia culicis subsp. floridensis]
MRLVLGIALLFFGLSVPGVHCSSNEYIKLVRKGTDATKKLSENEEAMSKAAEDAFMCLGEVVDKVAESIQSINGVLEKHAIVCFAEKDKEDIKKDIVEHLDGMSPEDVVKNIIRYYKGTGDPFVKLFCKGQTAKLFSKIFASHSPYFLDNLDNICESLRQLVGFINLFLIPLRKCGVGLNETNIITFDSIKEVRPKL